VAQPDFPERLSPPPLFPPSFWRTPESK